MREHIISITATNVYDQDDPVTVHLAYRVSCSCSQRWRRPFRDRQQAEAFGRTHLAYVREAATITRGSEGGR